jgi:3-hydroxyisobutyrate dehydrogenase-like beta-hydroxyacid dehydrogenase
METIAVLGMGLLGRGFAENLLKKGYAVRVYNRTPSRCDAVVAEGAIAAATPEECVRGASRVHLILSEDRAVDAVLEAAKPGLGDGVFVVDHSTNLPAGVAERFTRLRAEGVRYIHAPVFMGPSNSRGATGLMLLSGPSEDEAALRPALEEMTGKLSYFGDEPDKAAKIKLLGNGLLIMLTGAMGDLFRLGHAGGVSTDEVLALFDEFSPTASGMGRRALKSAGQPASFHLSMARKDLRLMLESAEGETLTLLPALAAAMDEAIDAGRGEEDFTSIAVPA